MTTTTLTRRRHRPHRRRRPRRAWSALLAIVVAAGVVLPAGTRAGDAPFSARISAGGGAYADSAGRLWSADAGFVGGAASAPAPVAVEGTVDDALYIKHRWAMSAYDVAVPCPARYRVDLHFAETYWYAAGQRVFDVRAEGTERISRLDVLAAAGRHAALVRSVDVDVADGAVNLEFTKVVENPMVSGIEVTQVTACTGDAPFSARISAGGGAYADSAGRLWSADAGFVGGAASAPAPVAVEGTVDDALYIKHRWAMSAYDVAVPCPARYRVDLHFAETYWYAAGQRVFDVRAEGTERISRLDVLAAAGRHAALVRSFDVDVADGAVNLEFTKVVENPMVSGIEVTQVTACTAEGATAAPQPASVHDVPATIASDCSRAVEVEIMAWLARVPNHAVARFAPGRCYGLDGSIVVADRSNLTVDGNGSTFAALTTGTSTRRNWRLQGGKEVTLKNMAVRGANPKGGIAEGAYDPAYEFQHGYSIEGTQGATLDTVGAFDVYGDFVAIHHDERYDPRTTAPARDVTIRNAHFERNGRQGVSPTNVEGFLLEGSYLGAVNMNAVDIELDFNEARVSGVRVANNTFGPVRFSLIGNVGGGSEPNVGGIELDGNTMLGPLVSCRPPVFVETPDGLLREGYAVTNNRLLAYGDAFNFIGVRNIVVSGNVVVFTDGGCGTRAGVGLVNSHAVSVTGNTFTGAAEILKQDALSTGVTASGNGL